MGLEGDLIDLVQSWVWCGVRWRRGNVYGLWQMRHRVAIIQYRMSRLIRQRRRYNYIELHNTADSVQKKTCLPNSTGWKQWWTVLDDSSVDWTSSTILVRCYVTDYTGWQFHNTLLTLSAGVQGSTCIVLSCTEISDRLLSACVFGQWQKRTAIIHAGWPHRRLNFNKVRATILCCVRSSSMEPAAVRHQESSVAGFFQIQTHSRLVYLTVSDTTRQLEAASRQCTYLR